MSRHEDHDSISRDIRADPANSDQRAGRRVFARLPAPPDQMSDQDLDAWCDQIITMLANNTPLPRANEDGEAPTGGASL